MKRRLQFSYAFLSLLFLIPGNFSWPHPGAPIASTDGQSASAENFTEFIRAARETALAYTANLPDFTCLQVTRRFERRIFQNPQWLPLETIKAEVSFLNGQEHYRILKAAEAGSGIEMENQIGSVSRGEYGTMIKQIFDPASATIFKLEGKDKRNKRETARLKFLIPKETSRYQLTYTEGGAINRTLVVSWGGKIWIDMASKQVVSIVSEAMALPMNFPFTSSKTLVDYELIPVGSNPTWLPVHAEFNSATGNLPDISPRMRSKEMKNVIEFSNYRKFTVEVRVKP